jgi:hypothetical protein
MLYIIALVFIGTFILYYLYIVSGVPCPRGGSFTLLILPAPVVLSICPLLLLLSLLSLFSIATCVNLSFPSLDDTSPSSFLLNVFLFPQEGRLHQFPLAIPADVDVVVAVAVVVLSLVLIGLCGCPVVGLTYRFTLRY